MSLMTISIRRSSAASAENNYVQSGASVRDLADVLDINLDKNIILRGDEELDADEILEDNDELVILPRKLSSGC